MRQTVCKKCGKRKDIYSKCGCETKGGEMYMTQRQWVEKTLRQDGKITRNQCLREYISRLGSIINKMKKDGWIIRSKYIKVNTQFGIKQDYEYTLVK